VRRLKMKRVNTALFIFCFLTGLALTQDWIGKGRQIGYVYDEQGEPLSGVKVKLFFPRVQSGFDATTDKDGKWVAMGIKGGEWNVDFVLPGYEVKKISISVQDNRQRNPEIVVKLKKIEGLVVTDELKKEFQHGNELFDQKKYQEALDIYNKIIAQFPDAYIINLSIAHCYFQMENYDEAEKYYKLVLEKEPQNSGALMGIGNIYSNRGDSAAAMDWYNKIAFDKIDDATVLYNIGTVFYNHSKLDEALKYYKKAVELQENFLDARYQLGLVYLAAGNKAEAIKEFETYLTYDADSQRAGQVKGFLEYLRK
jgi:thioredoxin-like negative regulator of GroEL